VRIDILTLFPSMFSGPMTESIIMRGQDAGKLQIVYHDLREFGLGRYRQVDDKPYGGGAGMLMRVDVLVPAIETITKTVCASMPVQSITAPHCIYFSPVGSRLTQPRVERLAAKHNWLLLVCGHYEGIDERVISGGWINEQISIGEYVLTGGELPAMVLIDAIARQIPGVLGKDESAHEESFSKHLQRKREYPHYTRPEAFRDWRVPDVLLGGHHAEIKHWRHRHTH
jgi:tRNA (guanine37-N1)-methyltransferase